MYQIKHLKQGSDEWLRIEKDGEWLDSILIENEHVKRPIEEAILMAKKVIEIYKNQIIYEN